MSNLSRHDVDTDTSSANHHVIDGSVIDTLDDPFSFSIERSNLYAGKSSICTEDQLMLDESTVEVENGYEAVGEMQQKFLSTGKRVLFEKPQDPAVKFCSDHYYNHFVECACDRRNLEVVTSQCKKIDCKCFKSAAMRLYRRQRQIIIPFIWGILVGITLTAVLFQQHILYRSSAPWLVDGPKPLPDPAFRQSHVINNRDLNSKEYEKLSTVSVREIHENMPELPKIKNDLFPSDVGEERRLKTRLFVGVITAEKFLGTRSLAVNNTWGGQVDKVEFFSAKGSAEKYGIPVVTLERASDTEYPPQTKAFEMLKHMCKHHINDFEWFVRADDDVYIRVQLLKKFLTQIDGDRMIYMGQPGHGVPEVRDKLGLNGHNFCMGGPGVIFNRNALKALCPHIDDCMKEVQSKEEDVEIGRCVTNHLHIECTHAWETLKLFYHSYQEEYIEEKPFLGNLAENEHVSKALTLHHLKIPYIMYRVHRHYTSLMLNSTVQELTYLHHDIDEANSKLPLGQQRHLAMEKSVAIAFKPRRLRDVNAWKSFGVDSVYSMSPADVMHDITNDVLADLKQIGETGIDEAIGYPQVQKFTYSHVSDGYMRSDPVRGTDYLLDVYFNSKKADVPDQIRRVYLLRPAGELEVSDIRQAVVPDSKGGKMKFYVILPVPRSRSSEFESFMRNHYEPTFLSRSDSPHTRLIVIPVGYKDPAPGQGWSVAPSPDEVVSWYRVKYPEAELVTLDADDTDNTDVASQMQKAYARGVVYAYEQTKEADRTRVTGAVALLTSTNVSLTPSVFRTCVFRTGKSASPNAHYYYSNYNFIDYKTSRRKAGSQTPPQIYQPVPFRVYPGAAVGPWPTAMVPQGAGLKPGAGGVPNSMVTSEIGFWDSSAAAGEDGNAVTAPLCGRVADLYQPANESLTATGTNSVTFRDALYRRVYAGHVTILRAPDRAFVNIPRR